MDVMIKESGLHVQIGASCNLTNNQYNLFGAFGKFFTSKVDYRSQCVLSLNMLKSTRRTFTPRVVCSLSFRFTGSGRCAPSAVKLFLRWSAKKRFVNCTTSFLS